MPKIIYVLPISSSKNPCSFFVSFDVEIDTEGYRSGHNGADSKSVWVQAHVGSNPILSARLEWKVSGNGHYFRIKVSIYKSETCSFSIVLSFQS